MRRNASVTLGSHYDNFIDLQIECIFLIFLLQNLLLNNLIYMLRNIVFICDSLLELYLLLNLKNTVFNFL